MSDAIDAFIEHWSKAEASERANSQGFLIALADLLALPRPSNDHHDGYSFEFPVKIPRGDGTSTQGFLDLYRKGCFVLESKQFVAPQDELSDLEFVAEEAGVYQAKKKTGPVRGSEAWDEAMMKARGQAERYARSLPADHPSPPFLLVVDVGHSIEVFADFTQAGKAYLPFPDPRSFRIRLADLRDEKIRDRLRRIWLEPLGLDPAKHSAEVTRTIAGYLAELAKSLEKAGHPPRLVAEFLTRCLFCMFAEDVGLLPKEGFRGLLESLRGAPEGFVPKLSTLFAEMQTGTDFSVILNRKLLRFNGGLFEDASVLPVDGLQLGILIKASAQQWKDVEPAIFGTLLERALDPDERHKLGAHYTPRAYVERLVLPTVIEPLRAEWESVRAAALLEAKAGRAQKARDEILRFHSRLCEVRVLDPACGSGNFLYVTLEHLKRLEGEVLDAAAAFGETMLLDLSTHTVDPHQFLGIELNPRAAAVAEMVLWIGYLQWHFRTRGQTMPEEPVLKKFRNIECRDAVLAWDGDPVPQRDEAGEIVTVWDRRSTKVDLVTGRAVPDESKRVPLLSYPNARPAEWPKADFIVGNPPFLGNKRMREALGSGYTETLREAYPDVPETADFVMYWLENAAALLTKETARFGFFTTNSITQTFNRSVLQKALDAGGRLAFAVPDHPWVDNADGAQVRVALSVFDRENLPGTLWTSESESSEEDGAFAVTFAVTSGVIFSDLSVGVDTSQLVALKSNEGLACPGVQLSGQGFVVSPEEVSFFTAATRDRMLRRYITGRDVTQDMREQYVLDTFGISHDELRTNYSDAFQWLYDRVKPERDQNPREKYRSEWWLHAEPRGKFRSALAGLKRFVVTSRTARHRTFQFLDDSFLPETKVLIFAFDDAFDLGVLSSRIHVLFANRVGGWLGVGNDSTYNHSDCLEKFPFPACGEAAKARIRELGEELDAHRKRVQAAHPGLTLTGMYNVLEALRAGRALTAKEQAIHEQGLVSVLRQLHDELDAAVAAAYGWDANLPDAEILTRLVALNAERAAEEAAGTIRWLRPDYQNPNGAAAAAQTGLALKKGAEPKAKVSKAKTPWPKTLAERVRVVDEALRAAPAPQTAEAMAKRFARAKPEDVAEILETLATLGRAHREGEIFTM